jgi:hypothetical protein
LQVSSLIAAQGLNANQWRPILIKPKKDKQMQLVLTNDAIVQRVNHGNSFTREEMLAYRDQIKAARAEKKTKLASLEAPQVCNLITAVLNRGGFVGDMKIVENKRTRSTWIKLSETKTLTLAERYRANAEKWLKKAQEAEMTVNVA